MAFVQVAPDGPPLSETRHLARALDAAIALQPNVLNLSFGGPEDRLLARLVEAADARGICLVAAAGNGGSAGRTPFPASHPKVLGVTAVDVRLAPYPWSTPGTAMDVAALGVDLVAAVPGGYRRVSGSSYASAIVSGALARTPACARDRNPAAMRAAVVQAARDLGAPGRDPRFGAGLFRLPVR
ncbi:S8 family serine peptidase [Phenylobacterium sp. J367]|uniref:S8 family serine peptidase n=1 Tax=Phenylobacterium sp. J367 TaxID=2898435 RepID=UPI002150E8EE|nr:S8 family serine peptidase [Phenylobacterium sp. J367]MCR5879651.1 S8 family serine peptidase [Phenylobacterium sp. J367]